jgi:hypothetical protein
MYISSVFGLLFVGITFAFYCILPLYFALFEGKFVIFSLLNLLSFLPAIFFGVKWVKKLLDFWPGLVIGSFLGVFQIAAFVFGCMIFHQREVHIETVLEMIYMVCGMISPLIVTNAFVSVLVAGAVMGVWPVFDWICDLVQIKKDYRGK